MSIKGLLKKFSYNMYDKIIATISFFGTAWLLFSTKVSTTLGGDYDDGVVATYSAIQTIVRNKEFPLWINSYWGGETAIGHMNMHVCDPIVRLLTVFCWDKENKWLSYGMFTHLYITILLTIFAFGLYILLINNGFKKINSWFIAILTMQSGAIFRVWGWMAVYLAAIFFVPYMIWCMQKALEENCGIRYTIGAAIFLALAGLTSPTQGIVMAIIFFCMYYLSFVIIEFSKTNFIKATTNYLFAGILGIMLMAVQLLPNIEFFSTCYRYAVSNSKDANSSGITYTEFIENSALASDIEGVFGAYNGWMAICISLSILSAFGIFLKNREKKKPIFCFAVISTIFSVLYGVGVFFPRLLFYIPFVNAVREPFLYCIGIVLGIPIIASYGMENIDNLYDKKSIKIIIPTFLVIISYGFLASNNKKLCSIIIFAFTVYMIAPLFVKRKNTIVKILMILVIFMAETRVMYKNLNIQCYTLDDAEEKIDMSLKECKALFDQLGINESQGQRIASFGISPYPMNVGAFLNIGDTVGYMNCTYSNIADVHKYFDYCKRYGVQNAPYFFCVENEDNKDFIEWVDSLYSRYMTKKDFIIDYEGNRSDLVVYKTPGNYGCGWFVNEVIIVDNKIEDIAEIFNSPSFNPGKQVISTSKYQEILPNNSYSEGKVELISYKSNSIQFYTTSNEKKILATSEIYNKYWKVYVDGKKQDCIEINGAFRGAVIPKGNHNVEFVFVPITFYIGTGISVIAIGICITVFANSKIRKKLNKLLLLI